MSKNVRSRGWCFTVNNYTDDDIAEVGSLYEDDNNCTYLIIGFEKGTRTKQPHLQCYIYYTEAVSWKTMHKLLYPNHFEAQKATKNAEAYVYCMQNKPDKISFFEYGERPRQGNRTDLEAIKYDILNGVSDKEIASSYFGQWCQYGKRFDAYREMMRPIINTKVLLYDPDQALTQFRKIRDDYYNYLIVTEMVLWTEVAKLVITGKYDYIFIPACPMYQEHFEELDGKIY